MKIDTLIERIKAILTSPDTEWSVIADERTTVADLYKRYVLILAAIPALFGFIKVSLLGIDVPLIGTMRVSIGAGLGGMVIGYALSVLQVYVIATVVDALAPTFNAQRNSLQALKLSAYSFTAVWIAGLGQIVPWIGLLISLAGGVYGIYLFYLGLPVMTKCPRDQAASYTLVSMAAAVVLSLLIGSVVASITGEKSSGHITRSDVEFNDGTPMGTLMAHTRKLEDAKERAERAQHPGDAGKPTNGQ